MFRGSNAIQQLLISRQPRGPGGPPDRNVSTLVSDRWGLSALLYHGTHQTRSPLAPKLEMIEINDKTTDVNIAFGIFPSREQRFAGCRKARWCRFSSQQLGLGDDPEAGQ